MAGNNATIGGGGFHPVAIRALGFEKKIAWGQDQGRAILLDTGDGSYLEIFANGEEGSKPEGAIIHFAIRKTGSTPSLHRRTV